MPAPLLDGWQVVTAFLGTTVLSAVVVILPFWMISRNEAMIRALTRGSPMYLRFITVILVVWSASLLAIQGRMDEGPSAIFGVIVGYVFGAINKPSPGQETP